MTETTTRAQGIDDAIDEVAVLADPVRRQLYRFVSAQPEGAGRDAAATAAGISRALAAFHLDRLAAAGLVDVTYRHLGPRRGPGAGRPAKIYRRAAREVVVNLPERRYDVAAELLASALELDLPPAPGGSASTTALEVAPAAPDGAPAAFEGRPPALAALAAGAHELGLSLGDEARRRAGPRPGRGRLLAAAVEVLAERGYEPVLLEDDSLLLRNCPFDALARRHRTLICGMNLSIMDGVLEGLRARGIHATLDPQPGRCCVLWGPTNP